MISNNNALCIKHLTKTSSLSTLVNKQLCSSKKTMNNAGTLLALDVCQYHFGCDLFLYHPIPQYHLCVCLSTLSSTCLKNVIKPGRSAGSWLWGVCTPNCLHFCLLCKVVSNINLTWWCKVSHGESSQNIFFCIHNKIANTSFITLQRSSIDGIYHLKGHGEMAFVKDLNKHDS